MELKTADIKEVQNHLYHHRIMTRITMFVIAVAVPWMITQAVTGIIWPVLSFIPMYYLFKAVMLHEQIRERRIFEAWVNNKRKNYHQSVVQGMDEKAEKIREWQADKEGAEQAWKELLDMFEDLDVEVKDE